MRRSPVEMASAAAFLAPASRIVQGTLYFSPGSVHQPELDPAFARGADRAAAPADPPPPPAFGAVVSAK
jgi:hypothetical protein